MNVDISSAVSAAESFVFPLLGIIVTWLAHRMVSVVEKKSGTQIDSYHLGLLDSMIAAGIGAARHALDGLLEGKTSIEIRNAVIANVVNFVTPKIPATLAYLGITPDGLAQRVAAVLGQSVALPVGTMPTSAPAPAPAPAPVPAAPAAVIQPAA